MAGALDAAGLLAPAFRARERWIALRASELGSADADGVPMPPARLRVLVDGHGDAEGFLADGRASAEMITATLVKAGIELSSFESILDFGCGCGRVARHWARLEGPALEGCDYNADLVAWCTAHLDFMRSRVNALSPPAPYEDDRFDFVYAISIFTHLTETLAFAWLDELERIVRPGGLLLFTTHGERYRSCLTPPEQQQFDAGELVVQRSRVAGTNACAAYHPRDYVEERLLRRFELVSFSGDGSDPGFSQDVYLVRASRPPDA
jgi:SAM-dependent methyltransferase